MELSRFNRWRAGAIALAVGLAGLALAGCGPKPEAGPKAQVPQDNDVAAIEALLNPQQAGPCAAPSPLLRLACGRQDLQDAAKSATERLTQELTALSPEGRRLLVRDVEAWVSAQRAACGVTAAAPPSEEAAACLRGELERWADGLDTAAVEVGPYRLQRRQVFEVIALSAQDRQNPLLGDEPPPALVQSGAFPRLDGPTDNPAIERFNALMTQELLGAAAGPTTQSIDYQLGYVGPELISVQFDDSSETIGAAHPSASMRAITVRMDTGEELAAGDLFKAGSGWEDFIVGRAMRALATNFEEIGAGPPAEAEVRDTALKTHNWFLTAEGLTLLFSPYAVGPYALGPQEVTIPWADLAPYLQVSAPAAFRGQ